MGDILVFYFLTLIYGIRVIEDKSLYINNMRSLFMIKKLDEINYFHIQYSKGRKKNLLLRKKRDWISYKKIVAFI